MLLLGWETLVSKYGAKTRKMTGVICGVDVTFLEGDPFDGCPYITARSQFQVDESCTRPGDSGSIRNSHEE